jgi:tetraacyldisaccharide 4'-kinase
MLKNENLNILEDEGFPDHYNYSVEDINKIYQKAKNLNAKIITTKKDFLRIGKTNNENLKFISVELKIRNESKLINILLDNNENN